MFIKLFEYDYQDELIKLNKYILSFIQFAVANGSDSFDTAAFKIAFPDDCEWLLNHPKFKEYMEKLCGLGHNARARIADAVENDINFHEFIIKRKDYELLGPTLDPSAKEWVQNFFLYIYSMFRSGIKLKCMSNQMCSRESFKESYLNSNPIVMSICPVCLNKSKGNKEQEVEHYFSKDIFPILSLHPYNLYFICKDCNKTYKGEKKPIDYGKNVRQAFLPYHESVSDAIDIVIHRRPESDYLRMLPKNDMEQYIGDKIRNFNRLFELESRWSDDLKDYGEILVATYMDEYDSNEKSEFISDIKDSIRLGKKGAKKNPHQYIQYLYYDWLQCNHMDALFSTISKKSDCN